MRKRSAPDTSQAQELQRRLDENPNERLRIIQEFFAERVLAGDRDSADFALLLIAMEKERISMDNEKNQAPRWLQPAGLCVGILTLIFFMALVGASVFGKVVPEAGKFPVLIVLALGTALSASFLTGYATMSGKIPFFGNQNPIAVSAGGGFAVLLLILLVGWKIYL